MTPPLANLAARHLGVLSRWDRVKRDEPRARLYDEIGVDGAPRRALTHAQLAQLVDEHRAALAALARKVARDEAASALLPYRDVLREWQGAWTAAAEHTGFDPLKHFGKSDSQK